VRGEGLRDGSYYTPGGTYILDPLVGPSRGYQGEKGGGGGHR